MPSRKQVGEHNRKLILKTLKTGDYSIRQMAEVTGVSFVTAFRHLVALQGDGLAHIGRMEHSLYGGPCAHIYRIGAAPKGYKVPTVHAIANASALKIARKRKKANWTIQSIWNKREAS